MPGKVLIDTSVWIEFFREKGSSVSSKVREYLKLDQVCYAGPIAVELYQGAKTSKEIQVIDELLQTIAYIEITRDHYNHAGYISQKAVREGKMFSTVDIILAVVAHDEKLFLFSFDKHFEEISQYCPLSLVPI